MPVVEGGYRYRYTEGSCTNQYSHEVCDVNWLELLYVGSRSIVFSWIVWMIRDKNSGRQDPFPAYVEWQSCLDREEADTSLNQKFNVNFIRDSDVFGHKLFNESPH